MAPPPPARARRGIDVVHIGLASPRRRALAGAQASLPEGDAAASMSHHERDWRALRQSLEGELLLDAAARERYAADESICWMMPEAVVIPKSVHDIRAV